MKMSVDLLVGVLYPDEKKDENIKRVLPEEYYGLNVSNFLERMVDPEPDFYNTTEYTDKEQKLCDKAIQNIDLCQNKNDYELLIKANTNQNSEYYPNKIELNKQNELCDYNEDILQQKMMKLPSGEEKFVNVIEMYLEIIAGGGAMKNYK
jgi:hypothetical protein